MNNFDEYPKAMYRFDSSEITPATMDDSKHYKVVNSKEEQIKFMKEGWHEQVSSAQQAAGKKEKRKKIFTFLLSKWEFWLTTIIALIALFSAYR